MANYSNSQEMKALMQEAKANAGEIIKGISKASCGSVLPENLELTFSADDADYYYDNVNFTIRHIPTGAAVFAWFRSGKWEVKSTLPRFNLSSATSLKQLMPHGAPEAEKAFMAGFGADAARKDWQKFGRGIWNRVFADTLANWHLVTEKQEKEAALEDQRAGVIRKLEARGWVLCSTNGVDSGRMSKKGAKMDISVDEFGSAKMTYAYATFDPERLAAFLEAEGEG